LAPIIVAALTVITALLTGAASYLQAAAALRESAEAGLVAARESRKAALVGYLESVEAHLASLARQPTVAVATGELRDAWSALSDEDQSTLRSLYDAMDNRLRNEGKRAVVTRLLAEDAARKPLLVVVEDIHWADPLTLAHLAAMAVTSASLRSMGGRPRRAIRW